MTQLIGWNKIATATYQCVTICTYFPYANLFRIRFRSAVIDNRMSTIIDYRPAIIHDIGLLIHNILVLKVSRNDVVEPSRCRPIECVNTGIILKFEILHTVMV